MDLWTDPLETSMKIFLLLRLWEYYRKGGREILRAIGPGSLLRDHSNIRSYTSNVLLGRLPEVVLIEEDSNEHAKPNTRSPQGLKLTVNETKQNKNQQTSKQNKKNPNKQQQNLGTREWDGIPPRKAFQYIVQCQQSALKTNIHVALQLKQVLFRNIHV